MEFQVSGDSTPSEFITDEMARKLIGKPPASGAWRDGDPVGDRKFTTSFDIKLESGKKLDSIKIAYESWGSTKRLSLKCSFGPACPNRRLSRLW